MAILRSVLPLERSLLLIGARGFIVRLLMIFLMRIRMLRIVCR